MDKKTWMIASRGNRRMDKYFFVKKFLPLPRPLPILILQELFIGLMVTFFGNMVGLSDIDDFF